MIYLNKFDIVKIKELLDAETPFVVDKRHRILDFLNKEYLLNNFYDLKVGVSNNFFTVESDAQGRTYFEDSDSVKVLKLGEYIEEYVNKSDTSRYLKSLESEYDLLAQMGLDNIIREDFSQYKNPFCADDISLWYGCKGTGSPFHYDDEDFNLLYICEGVKKLYLIDPKYNEQINKAGSWHLWQDVPTETKNEILNHPNILHKEVTLRAGQILSIPAFWYHCADNIEDTMAITYHYLKK